MPVQNAPHVLKEKLANMGDQNYCPVIILVRNDAVLTGLRHYTKKTWENVSHWTIPGGRCEAGETLEQTLQREVYEEVGIKKFDITGFIGEVPGAKAGDILPIFFGITKENARLMEPEKFSEWKWVPLKAYLSGESYSGYNPAARKLIVDFLTQLKT